LYRIYFLKNCGYNDKNQLGFLEKVMVSKKKSQENIHSYCPDLASSFLSHILLPVIPDEKVK